MSVTSPITVSLVNPGAEAGTTGWTNELGALGTLNTNPAPKSGTAYFYCGNNAETRARQRIDLIASGLDAAEIDAGGCRARLQWAQASWDGLSDPGQCGLRFLSTGLGEVGVTWAESQVVTPAMTWVERAVAGLIPTGARYLDVLIHGVRTTGADNDAYFDDIRLSLIPSKVFPPAIAGVGLLPGPTIPMTVMPVMAGAGSLWAPSRGPSLTLHLTARRSIPLILPLTAVCAIPLTLRLTARRSIPGRLVLTMTAVRAIPRLLAKTWTAVRAIPREPELQAPLALHLIARRVIPSDGVAVRRTAEWSATLDDGTALDLLGASLSGDRDSCVWACSLTLPDEATWLACSPGRRLTLTLAGQPFALLLDARSRDVACGSESWQATARTISCLLDAPYAATLSQSWPETTARTAAEGLAALAGLPLSWEVCDWVLPAGRLAAEVETPASVLARLAASCGAVVLPAPAGGVVVRYRYPVSVPEMASAAPRAMLSDDADVITLAETFVAASGYNAVTVTDNRASTEPYLACELDSDRNAGRSTFPPGEPIWLRVYHESEYTLRSSLGRLELVTVGIEESEDATIGFEDTDTAALGKLVLAVDSVRWFGPDLGALTPAGGADVVASGGAGFSVAVVTYRSRYDLWRLTADAVADAYSIQVAAEEADT